MTRLLAVATLALTAALGACGGARSTPPPHRPPVTAAGSGSSVEPTEVTAASPTDAECDALVAHALAIEMAERPADQQLAEPEQTRLLAQLRDEQRPGCRALSRDAYRCILASAKVADLASCK